MWLHSAGVVAGSVVVVGKCIGVRSDSGVIYSKVNLLVIEVLKMFTVFLSILCIMMYDITIKRTTL